MQIFLYFHWKFFHLVQFKLHIFFFNLFTCKEKYKKIAKINKASVARISEKIDFTFKDILIVSFYVDKNPYWHARKFTYVLHTNLTVLFS